MRKTRPYVVSDYSGKEIPEEQAETVMFSLGNDRFETDLTRKEADSLRRALAPFMENARRVNHKPLRVAGQGGGDTGETTSRTRALAIRVWAWENGYDLPTRGRLPRNVVQDYERHEREQAGIPEPEPAPEPEPEPLPVTEEPPPRPRDPFKL